MVVLVQFSRITQLSRINSILLSPAFSPKEQMLPNRPARNQIGERPRLFDRAFAVAAAHRTYYEQNYKHYAA